MASARPPWTPPVPDDVWDAVEPVLPCGCPAPTGRGHLAVPDRCALNGILYVLAHEIDWPALPPELGFGSGMSCWRRLEHWRAEGAWPVIEAALDGAYGRGGGAELAGAGRG